MQEDAKGEKNRDKDQKCAETRTGHCSKGNVYEWEGIHEVRDTWSETNDGRDARHKGESGDDKRKQPDTARAGDSGKERHPESQATHGNTSQNGRHHWETNKGRLVRKSCKI